MSEISALDFVCVKCGECCRNLLVYAGSAGLMLFPEEVKLFKKTDVRPCLAVGKSLTHSSFKILTYQLKLNVCPHLEGNSCTMYLERPNACRGYPFARSENLEIASYWTDQGCTVIKEFEKRHGGIQNVVHCQSIEENMEGNKKLIREFQKIKNRKNKKTWVYDLRTEKWKRR